MRSSPVQGTLVRISVPHPYPLRLHMTNRMASMSHIGAKRLGLLARS